MIPTLLSGVALRWSLCRFVPPWAVVTRLLPIVALLMACPPGVDTTWDPAYDATDTGWLLSTWSPDGEVRFAVGGEPEAGIVMSDAGGEWASVATDLDVPLLNWVYGFGADDLWVVGNGGTIIHWDGSTWSEVESSTTEDLWGVWGASPDDLWAVGGSGFPEATATLLRYDGASWSTVELPPLERPGVKALFKVWGTGPSDVFIVGQRGTLLRWDGSALREELVGTSDDLISVWGTGPDRVAVVGGRSNGVISTWDGTEWRTESLSPLPGLNGVWMGESDTVHVVGIEGTIAVVDFESLDYEEALPATTETFHAVFGDPSERLTAVGGNFASSSGHYVGIAYERELAGGE